MNLPVQETPSEIYGIEGPSEICTQSAEVRLAVRGAQPLFTFGLLMFALSLANFLSLPKLIKLWTSSIWQSAKLQNF